METEPGVSGGPGHTPSTTLPLEQPPLMIAFRGTLEGDLGLEGKEDQMPKVWSRGVRGPGSSWACVLGPPSQVGLLEVPGQCGALESTGPWAWAPKCPKCPQVAGW